MSYLCRVQQKVVSASAWSWWGNIKINSLLSWSSETKTFLRFGFELTLYVHGFYFLIIQCIEPWKCVAYEGSRPRRNYIISFHVKVKWWDLKKTAPHENIYRKCWKDRTSYGCKKYIILKIGLSFYKPLPQYMVRWRDTQAWKFTYNINTVLNFKNTNPFEINDLNSIFFFHWKYIFPIKVTKD